MIMLRVNIESVIKNVFIVNDDIYFEDDKGVIVNHPANRYTEGTDSYEASELFLFNKEYLNFNDSNEVKSFMEYCITQYHNDIYIFNYKSLGVVLDYMDNPEAEDVEELMRMIKLKCVK